MYSLIPSIGSLASKPSNLLAKELSAITPDPSSGDASSHIWRDGNIFLKMEANCLKETLTPDPILKIPDTLSLQAF